MDPIKGALLSYNYPTIFVEMIWTFVPVTPLNFSNTVRTALSGSYITIFYKNRTTSYDQKLCKIIQNRSLTKNLNTQITMAARPL